jgi:TM2 domain-containing membrane protein YozV
LGINCFFLAPVIFFWNLDVQGEVGEGKIYALIGAIWIFIPVCLAPWVLAIIDASLKSPQRYKDSHIKLRL